MTEYDIVDNTDAGRFETTVDGMVAELTYRHDGDRLVLVHTGVPDALEGRGVGSALVRFAVERARDQQLTVVPRCPFAANWLQSHEDLAATLSIDWAAATRR